MNARMLQRIRKKGGVIEDQDKLLKWFGKVLCSILNGEYVLEIRTSDRTDAQNRYYWVIINMMAKEVGIRPDEMHNMMKEMFLPSREYIIFARKRQLSSTTDQNTCEMADYMDSVIRFAETKLNMVIPDIEEYKHKYQ